MLKALEILEKLEENLTAEKNASQYFKYFSALDLSKEVALKYEAGSNSAEMLNSILAKLCRALAVSSGKMKSMEDYSKYKVRENSYSCHELSVLNMITKMNVPMDFNIIMEGTGEIIPLSAVVQKMCERAIDFFEARDRKEAVTYTQALNMLENLDIEATYALKNSGEKLIKTILKKAIENLENNQNKTWNVKQNIQLLRAVAFHGLTAGGSFKPMLPWREVLKWLEQINSKLKASDILDEYYARQLYQVYGAYFENRMEFPAKLLSKMEAFESKFNQSKHGSQFETQVENNEFKIQSGVNDQLKKYPHIRLEENLDFDNPLAPEMKAETDILYRHPATNVRCAIQVDGEKFHTFPALEEQNRRVNKKTRFRDFLFNNTGYSVVTITNRKEAVEKITEALIQNAVIPVYIENQRQSKRYFEDNLRKLEEGKTLLRSSSNMKKINLMQSKERLAKLRQSGNIQNAECHMLLEKATLLKEEDCHDEIKELSFRLSELINVTEEKARGLKASQDILKKYEDQEKFNALIVQINKVTIQIDKELVRFKERYNGVAEQKNHLSMELEKVQKYKEESEKRLEIICVKRDALKTIQKEKIAKVNKKIDMFTTLERDYRNADSQKLVEFISILQEIDMTFQFDTTGVKSKKWMRNATSAIENALKEMHISEKITQLKWELTQLQMQNHLDEENYKEAKQAVDNNKKLLNDLTIQYKNVSHHFEDMDRRLRELLPGEQSIKLYRSKISDALFEIERGQKHLEQLGSDLEMEALVEQFESLSIEVKEKNEKILDMIKAQELEQEKLSLQRAQLQSLCTPLLKEMENMEARFMSNNRMGLALNCMGKVKELKKLHEAISVEQENFAQCESALQAMQQSFEQLKKEELTPLVQPQFREFSPAVQPQFRQFLPGYCQFQQQPRQFWQSQNQGNYYTNGEEGHKYNRRYG